jgi:hypothetical protein
MEGVKQVTIVEVDGNHYIEVVAANGMRTSEAGHPRFWTDPEFAPRPGLTPDEHS